MFWAWSPKLTNSPKLTWLREIPTLWRLPFLDWSHSKQSSIWENTKINKNSFCKNKSNTKRFWVPLSKNKATPTMTSFRKMEEASTLRQKQILTKQRWVRRRSNRKSRRSKSRNCWKTILCNPNFKSLVVTGFGKTTVIPPSCKLQYSKLLSKWKT